MSFLLISTFHLDWFNFSTSDLLERDVKMTFSLWTWKILDVKQKYYLISFFDMFLLNSILQETLTLGDTCG